MKLHQALLVAALFAVTALMGVVHGPIAAALTFFVLGNLITPQSWVPAGRLSVTLTATTIVQKTIEALVTKRPILTRFAHEFTTERLKQGQQAIAHIKVKPTDAEYDANNGGYKAGANELRNLLVDVPLTMDRHRHVTIKLSHLNAIADNKGKLESFFADQAEVLGRGMTNYCFGLLRNRNFANASTFSIANSDKDMLSEVRRKGNTQGMPTTGRFGIVNSEVMEVLDNDSRISNRNDGGSQLIAGSPLGRLVNVSGFEEIVEDPDFPTNNGSAINITGDAGTDEITTASDHGFIVGDRVDFPALTGGTGLTAGGTVYHVVNVSAANKLKVSATAGGSAVDFSTNVTAGTVRLIENVSGFFGTEEALAIKTGLPTDGLDAAEAFGIPMSCTSEVVTDPNSGLSMVAYKWFENGTMDAYVTVAFLYGAAAGRQGGASGAILDKAGHLLRTA